MDSTSPQWGEKACYYSGVCLETGEVEAMEIAGNSNAETSTAFLQQLRANYPGPLVVIWDNGPAHRGAAIRSHLATPDLHLRLVALPAYSPDFNADEAVWDWAREEVTANECLGPAYSPDFNADEAVWDWAREEVTANECLGTVAVGLVPGLKSQSPREDESILRRASSP